MIFHQPHNSKSNYNYNAVFYTKEKWDPHFHKNLELIYVIKGAVVCSVGSKTETLSEGDFGLSLSNEIHSYSPCENSQYWVGVFSEDYVRTFANKTQDKVGEGFRFRCADSVKDYLVANLITKESPPIYMLKSCLYAVCEEYSKQIDLKEKNLKDSETVFKITEYILKNHKNDISLSDISNLLGYDYHYVSRLFHSVFNMSFAEYLTSYRMGTAIALLDETDKAIADIAFESGFQSVRSFNNSFKNRYGTTPSAYRKIKK